MSIWDVALDPSTVVVAVDPGKVMNRVWVSNGLGLLEDPVSLPVARAGIERLEALLAAHPSPASGDRDRGDRVAAPGVGCGAGAPSPGCVAAVRSLGDQGRPHPAGVWTVQDR